MKIKNKPGIYNRRSKVKTITVFPVGGLGNQLFVLAGGVALSKLLHRKLRIDFSRLEISTRRFRVRNISDLSLPFPIDKNQGSFITPLAKIRKSRTFLFLMRVLRKFSRSQIWLKEIGFLRDVVNVANSKKNIKVMGYFQSYKYAEEIRSLICNSLDKIKVSSWTRELILDMQKVNPIVVHIRLGDYLQEKNAYFGVLHKEYYERAVYEMNKDQEARELWVFSNDLILTKKWYSNLALGRQTRWINPPKEVDDLENLYLMSQAKSFVIGNSTYGWWSAFLAGTNSEVIAPMKWFREGNDPFELCPPNWKRIESKWQDLE